MTRDDIAKAITALRAALEQQPVACAYPKCQTTGGCAGACRSRYTAPQPAVREWVGLTDDEIYEAQEVSGRSFNRHRMGIRGQQVTPADSYEWHLAHAIEAKLKEKNT